MFSLTRKLCKSITTPNLPKKMLEQSQNCAAFLKMNKFKPDSAPFGLSNLYGLHRDNVDLTIMYTENDKTQTLWKFLNSHYIPRSAYFVNSEGHVRLFDFTDPAELKRTTKMDVI